MKKRAWVPAAVTAGFTLFLMLLLPLAVINWPNELALELVLILYYGVNPLFVVIVGVCAGLRPRERWYLPVIPAALYPFLSALLFRALELSYFQAAAVYLVLGAASLGAAVLFSRLQGRR